MSQTLSIEDALRKIAADNDLRYISFDINHDQAHDSSLFGACVQWDGESTTGVACASGHGPDVASALTLAIAECKVRRGEVSADLPTLEMAVPA